MLSWLGKYIPSLMDGVKLSFSGGNVLLNLCRWTIFSVVEQHEYGYPAVVPRCNQGGRCKTTMTRRSICFDLVTNPTVSAAEKELEGKAGSKRNIFQ